MSPNNAITETSRCSQLVKDQPKRGVSTDHSVNVAASAALANPHSSSKDAIAATLDGMRSLNPADAIEVALSAQILTANTTRPWNWIGGPGSPIRASRSGRNSWPWRIGRPEDQQAGKPSPDTSMRSQAPERLALPKTPDAGLDAVQPPRRRSRKRRSER